MELEKLEIYNLSNLIGEKVWVIVKTWNYFEKDTIGKQWVRAIDSIAANISEGYGRYHYKDARIFYFYARGSLYESKTWLVKAYKRCLVSSEDYDQLESQINKLGIKLNRFIKTMGSQPNTNDASEVS